MRYDDLAGLSPVVRKEVLTGELSRRVKALGTVPPSDVDAIVEALVGVSLSEIVQAIEDPEKLAHQVDKFKISQESTSHSQSQSPARSASASQDSRLLDPNALAATASAPEHPSTPISVNASLSTPPRTSSPSGSVPPTSERDRMAAAVAKFENSPSETQEKLTDLLMSLPKRERAMCLFNMEVFRAKLADARLVLETMEEEEESVAPAMATTAIPPSTPQNKKSSFTADSPQTPDLSSRGPSASSSPLPTTPAGAVGTPAGTENPTYTIASLAKLPAVDVLKVVRSSSVVLPAGLSKADPLVVQATDEFVDGLMDKAPQMQKQQLGEKLFKVVKSFGIKGAPKVTVTLLDQEDLRALAHLMNSYPAVLKDKAQAVMPTK
jgi:polyadenylate-binding protein